NGAPAPDTDEDKLQNSADNGDKSGDDSEEKEETMDPHVRDLLTEIDNHALEEFQYRFDQAQKGVSDDKEATNLLQKVSIFVIFHCSRKTKV
ncbi:unnamed protein product, partial [Strongylus vulgaris]